MPVKTNLELELDNVRQELEVVKQLNIELEQLLAEKTAQLQMVNKELETFSYSVSHDLRAPIRGIDGFSEAILGNYVDKLDEKGQKYFQRIRECTGLMTQLIDDLLSLSRLIQYPLNIEKNIDLSAMAQNIADDLLTQEPVRQVHFKIADTITANGDRNLLQIVLQNLLNNAWKFTSKHATAHIQFEKCLEGETPVYCIKDDGAGFNMDYASKLFGVFQRLHTTQEFPGRGIGLTTVARIIHRHGGKIRTESAVEKGAAFYFTLNAL